MPDSIRFYDFASNNVSTVWQKKIKHIWQ
jgi:hypothetical protein